MEKPHSGLDICVMVVTVGVVDGVLTTVVWGGVGMPQYDRLAYPSQHQCRALYMIFYGFTILKLIRIMFLTCICIIKKNNGGLCCCLGPTIPKKV